MTIAKLNDPLNRWGFILLWLLLTTTVFFRQPIPIDETRYLSVAWEMWLHNDFLVPYLNGLPYSHKPPLLFWLYQLGWLIFGVNDWWPAMIGPICALANLFLVRVLAEKLWPDHKDPALLVPWILISTLLWTLFATSAMFDTLLTCWVLLAILGGIESADGNPYKGCLYMSTAIGLGLLTKGPVIFLHILPTLILQSFYSTVNKPRAYSVSLLLATLMGIMLALCWAIPAAIEGGGEYAKAIFWHQSANRTLGVGIHTRHFLWYLPLLPMILFPWMIWPQLWKNLGSTRLTDDHGLTLCLMWLTSTLLVFSCLPSKQIHYLLPVLPAFALLTAKTLSTGNDKCSLSLQLSAALAFGVVGIFLIFMPMLPLLSEFKWVQSVNSEWGIGVLAIAALLTATSLYFKQLSVKLLSTALVSSVCLSILLFFASTGLAYDLKPAALLLKSMNDQGINCAFIGNYQGQLHFLGRLTQPLPTLSVDQVADWSKQHKHGCLISIEKQKPETARYLQAYREYWLVFRDADKNVVVSPI